MIDASRLQRYATDPLAYFSDATIPGGARLGDVWGDFQRKAFRALADSMLPVATGSKPPYRGLWIERTKGASKDSDIALALNWLLMFSPQPQLVEAGADDFDQIGELRKAMRDDLRLNPWKAQRLTVQSTKVLNESTGSECDYLTCDATGSHGSRPTVTVLNELSHIQSEAFALTLMDNADKMEGNLAIVATNSGFLGTWQHRWQLNYRDDPRWWFQRMTDVAPWIDPAKVADAERRNPPSRFKRLWKGVWAAGGGDAFDEEDIRRLLIHDGPMSGREDRYSPYLVGVDVGTSQHHSAVVVLAVDHANRSVRLADCRDFAPRPKVDLARVEETIIELGRRFKVSCIASDFWQFERTAQTLREKGFATEEVRSSNQQATCLLEAVQSRRLALYDDPLLTEDLLSASVEERPATGGYYLRLPEGRHGHCDRLAALCCALVVAMRIANQPYFGPNYKNVVHYSGEGVQDTIPTRISGFYG